MAVLRSEAKRWTAVRARSLEKKKKRKKKGKRDGGREKGKGGCDGWKPAGLTSRGVISGFDGLIGPGTPASGAL